MEQCNYCKDSRELVFLGLDKDDLRFYCKDRDRCRKHRDLAPADSKEELIGALEGSDRETIARLMLKPVVSRLDIEDALFFARYAVDRGTGGISDTISMMIKELRDVDELKHVPLENPAWGETRGKQISSSDPFLKPKGKPQKPEKTQAPKPEPEPEAPAKPEEDVLEL